MNETSKKKRKGLRWIILGAVVVVLLLLWALVPMKVCQAPFRHVFDLNSEEVVQIEMDSPVTGQFDTYTEPEEIEEVVEMLNGLQFHYWLFFPYIDAFSRTGWDQGLRITTQEGSQFYTFRENSITFEDSGENSYEFRVTDGLGELMERLE